MTDAGLLIGNLGILLASRKQRAGDAESSPILDIMRWLCDMAYVGQLLWTHFLTGKMSMAASFLPWKECQKSVESIWKRKSCFHGWGITDVHCADTMKI